MPKAAIPRSRPRRPASSTASSSKVATHRVPDQTHDYRLDPDPFPALKTEQGVFTTPPYSAEIKGSWRYKDQAAARESSSAIWGLFMAYRRQNDFIGADTARKFIQMGRTRSLRYALRPGGKKYKADAETGEKTEMKRTGEVYDQGKLDGAGVFEEVLKRCWADGWYADMFERWRKGDRGGEVKLEGENEAGGSPGQQAGEVGEDVKARRGKRAAQEPDAEAEELVEVKQEER